MDSALGEDEESGDSSDDGSSDEASQDNGGFVLVKSKRAADGNGRGDDEGDGEREESDGESEAVLEKGGRRKEKKIRITRDGVAATAVGARKKIFDEDGEPVVSATFVSAFAAYDF